MWHVSVLYCIKDPDWGPVMICERRLHQMVSLLTRTWLAEGAQNWRIKPSIAHLKMFLTDFLLNTCRRMPSYFGVTYKHVISNQLLRRQHRMHYAHTLPPIWCSLLYHILPRPEIQDVRGPERWPQIDEIVVWYRTGRAHTSGSTCYTCKRES